MPTITVTPNTNIVLVNTASADQTTVNLPPVTPGQLITIRDNVGAASSSNQITITTTGGSVFSTGTVLPDGNSNIKISQPFGAVTVGYSGGYKWNILNTFAFENPAFAKVDAVTVSSITFRDSGGNGNNYQLKVLDDILYKDGIKIIEAPEFNLGIARHNGGVSSLSSIVSYGLSTVAAHPHYGLSSLSSIVSYGLSTVAAHPHYGVSSLSSIVSYGLSSIVGASGSGTPSNWATYPATSNINMSNYSITNLSNITVNGALGVPSKSVLVVADGTKLQTVLNGVDQGGPNNIGSSIYDIYYNGSLWLAGGNTNGFIYYSSDGSNWTINTTETLSSGIIYNIIYADNKWVAVGENGLAYSTDGFNWTNNINLTNANLRCVAYNNNNWVIGGTIGNNWTLATLNNITSNFTPVPNGAFTTDANRVLYANNIWVAVGRDISPAEIQYSTDSVDWYAAINTTTDPPTSINFGGLQGGIALAYGNGYWLAGGEKYIYGSSDGSNFSVFNDFGDNIVVYDIKYEGGSTFYATYYILGGAGILTKSTDNGSNWATIDNFTGAVNRIGISYTPAVTGIDNILIGGGALTTTNINASNITVGGTLMVGGVQITGGDSISNWATYFANSNLDMGQCNIINVGDISMIGELTLPKFTNIVFGDPTENLSIGNNNIDSLSYLTLSGPTYINGTLTLSNTNIIGTLTLSNTNIIGPVGTLTYNDDPIGGGDASTWSANVATQNVDMNGCNISNVNSLQFGTTPNIISLTTYIEDEIPYLLVDGIANTVIDFNGYSIINAGGATITNDVSITGANGLDINGPLTVSSDTAISGTLTVGGVSITGDGSASNWATYPATSNLNMGGRNISNVNNIEVKSATEFPSNTTLLIPSYLPAPADTGRINRFLNENNVGFVNLGSNEVIYDIFYNNSLWIAVGETRPLGHIYTSSNGTTWNKSASVILPGNSVSYNIIYASNIWVLVGSTNDNRKIVYSTDGYNWSTNPTTINQTLRCVGYNGSNKWVIGGELTDGWTLATLDNITSGTFTPATDGFTNAANRVLYGNNIWVAVGHDTNNAEIQYSTNGSQWYPALNVDEPDTSFFNTQQGKALAYGNGYWLAGGNGNNIYGSSNGINFSVFHVVESDRVVDDIKYESGSTFYATFRTNSSNILAKSIDNGSNWSDITNIVLNSVASRIGISYIPSYFVNSNTIIGGGTLNTSNLIVSNKLTLNNNTFTTLVNPVGAYIEIRKTLLSSEFVTSTYPLYIGNSINITRTIGWWALDDQNTLPTFSGIILLPNYTIAYDSNINGNNTLTRSNTSNIPSYTGLTGGYRYTLYYTLTYTPT